MGRKFNLSNTKTFGRMISCQDRIERIESKSLSMAYLCRQHSATAKLICVMLQLVLTEEWTLALKVTSFWTCLIWYRISMTVLLNSSVSAYYDCNKRQNFMVSFGFRNYIWIKSSVFWKYISVLSENVSF